VADALPDVQGLSVADQVSGSDRNMWDAQDPTAAMSHSISLEAAALLEPPRAGDTLTAVALKVLRQPDPSIKADWTTEASGLWRSGRIDGVSSRDDPMPPDTPARPSFVALVEPWNVPKLGRGGTLASRLAMLHSLVHIEGVAVDLAWDAVARFGRHMPREFSNDFVAVAEDEARHFTLLEERLRELGSHYGALPAHEGLWESARATAHSLPARLAIESCVHEARGLDVLPQTIARFRNGGDSATADLLLSTVYPEEVSHCMVGTKWLTWLFQHPNHTAALSGDLIVSHALSPPEATPGSDIAAVKAQSATSVRRSATPQPKARTDVPAAALPGVPQTAPAEAAEPNSNGGAKGSDLSPLQFDTVQSWFQALVKTYFQGNLKGPFNEEARSRAGFDPTWYESLVADGRAISG